jgi:transposase
MIGPGGGARVMVDPPGGFLQGADSPAALVGSEYGGGPYSGVIYVFRRSERIGSSSSGGTARACA